MPRKTDFTFDVQIRIAEAFTLDSIVRNPRTFKPKDVQSACQNNRLVIKQGDPPPAVISLATYVMTDFFAVLHATGLYNRQKSMWESLSKVNSIAVTQLAQGLLQKKEIPIYDLHFLDYKGKPLISATLVTELPAKMKAETVLKDFISRSQGKQGQHGVILCFPAPFPEGVLESVEKQTHTADPVGRYESIYPSLKVPIDLLEMDKTNLASLSQEGTEPSELRTIFQLVHPDLKKGRPPGMAQSTWTYKRKEQNGQTAENGSPTNGDEPLVFDPMENHTKQDIS